MALACAALVLAALAALSSCQRNPPVWPSTVQVFSPQNSAYEIQTVVEAIYSLNGGPDEHGQFSQERFAILFEPGRYDADVPVGYYTQVAGLGDSPSDVVFTSSRGVFAEEASKTISPGALNTFWRSAENFRVSADYNWFGDYRGMLWATSQATPLRNIVVDHDLLLFQYIAGMPAAGFASGGFAANIQVQGTVRSGSQQQYLMRNCRFSGFEGGVWNMVFVGTEGAPGSHCGKNQNASLLPIVTVGVAPVVVEKPFISMDRQTRKYFLNVPFLVHNKSGAEWSRRDKIPFDQVYVADASKDTADSINAKLGGGFHVVLAPGIYKLSAPLKLVYSGQVLLGLGLATLVAENPVGAVQVGDGLGGVRVAGVLLEAGDEGPEVLLEWGSKGSSPKGSEVNPGAMHDVFARVCGPDTPANPSTKVFVRINSGNVIGDNLWLWRADHDVKGLVRNGRCACDTALQVFGNDVTMYGLAVEHTLKDIVSWHGERGRVYFFQSELPYDVSRTYGEAGYAGYRVDSNVKEHNAWGAGVYHYFRDAAVVVDSGISVPAGLEKNFVSPLATYLNGTGTLRHVINSKGKETSSRMAAMCGKEHCADPQWWCGSASPEAAGGSSEEGLAVFI